MGATSNAGFTSPEVLSGNTSDIEVLGTPGASNGTATEISNAP